MNRELPVILNTEMVKAVLSGNKIQTRRPLNKKLRFNENPNDYFIHMCEFLEDWNPGIKKAGYYAQFADGDKEDPSFYEPIKAPYDKGDIIYVRETLVINKYLDIYYKADNMAVMDDWMNEHFVYRKPEFTGEIPSIHMPKKAARLFLKVTNVRVERLNDISEQDSVKEGLYVSGGLYRGAIEKNGCKGGYSNPINAFKSIWNSIYNNWTSNPWVWVIDFEVVKK